MKKRWKIRLQPKLLLGLITMAAILGLTLAPAVSQLYRTRMEEYYSQLAFGQASIAAQLIDGDRIETYYRQGTKDDYYHKIHRYLQSARVNMGLQYFYVVVPEEEVMYYIWDAGVAGEDGVCDLGDTDAYYGGGNELMHSAFAANAPQTILITNNEEYGYLASAYVAILGSSGQPVALASVDISMDMINQQIRTFLAVTVCITLIVLLVSILVYHFYVRKIVIRPLDTLHHAAMGLVKDQMAHLEDFQVEVHTGDEVEELADSFRFMVQELNDYIQNLSRVTAEKERISTELDVARHIQASMLPCIFPPFPDRKEFEIFATMNPAKEVGGDFYDFFMVDDTHLAVVMADVSGKGVPAALFMVIGKTLIKDHTQPNVSLGEVFSRVNNLLCDSNSQGLFITAFEGVLDLVTGEFRYVNAGHEPPYIASGQGFQSYKIRPGFVLAGMENIRYREGSLTLAPGDRIFLYTDGVTEATNGNNELYGFQRLDSVLAANSGGTPEAVLQAVKEDVDRFVGDAPQFDDITMLCLHYCGQSGQEGGNTHV